MTLSVRGAGVRYRAQVTDIIDIDLERGRRGTPGCIPGSSTGRAGVYWVSTPCIRILLAGADDAAVSGHAEGIDGALSAVYCH